MNRLVIRDEILRKRALDLISGLNLAKPWEITVHPYKAKRSLEQNALYWSIVSAIADYTGHSRDEAHEAMKVMFLAPKCVEIAGHQCEFRTTTKLTVKDMSEYIERCYAFASSELGLFIHVPEEDDPRH